MKGMTMLYRCGPCYFAISCCIMFTGLVPVWGQPVSGFLQVHFDGTFLFLGQHILDTSDIGVLLQRTNPNFKNLPNQMERTFLGIRMEYDTLRAQKI